MAADRTITTPLGTFDLDDPTHTVEVGLAITADRQELLDDLRNRLGAFHHEALLAHYDRVVGVSPDAPAVTLRVLTAFFEDLARAFAEKATEFEGLAQRPDFRNPDPGST